MSNTRMPDSGPSLLLEAIDAKHLCGLTGQRDDRLNAELISSLEAALLGAMVLPLYADFMRFLPKHEYQNTSRAARQKMSESMPAFRIPPDCLRSKLLQILGQVDEPRLILTNYTVRSILR